MEMFTNINLRNKRMKSSQTLLKIQVFWDVTRCLLVGRFGRWVITSFWLSLLDSMTPNGKVLQFLETSVTICKSTRRNILQEMNLQILI